MPNTAEQVHISHQDYLAGELESPVKHEYLAGQVFAMAGASEAHATIAGNLFALLRPHVRGTPCRVYMADMKVRVDAADAFYYPDVFVTCSAADAAETYVKRDPTLIVEVLSNSTAAFDHGKKFAHYRQLPSLREYVLVDPERLSIDVFRRNDRDQWVLFPFGTGQTLELASIGFSAEFEAIYEDVDLA
ncbi:Uma2 family endonuclease [Thiorhodococcus mannitoliphagus]|uniref:Uma2 family endonuclease n=1 Tax=Thiorhodococcus mannitoliphagus TaxID=329406 RepID=A0A6P1DWC3_9GAMM|nr:Uma2 family endonuclease [Thiorhodococcus mannitoliphagus]NEX21760.1 Uma2 family endonuclease [Thiorhodococcus mannitoliphagus]